MRETTKQNIRGALLLIPLVIIAMALMLLARPNGREVATPDIAERAEVATDSISHFSAFDPNTADYRTMTEAGLPRNIAVSILKWREAGKVFRIREDVALCYGMTDSLYFLIEPYITIGEEFRIKPSNDYRREHYDNHSEQGRSLDSITYTPFLIDTATADYLLSLGFSRREAELVVRYREMIGGYRSMEEFAECYAVDSAMAERLRPYIIFPKRDTSATIYNEREKISFPININTADSATLRRVRGIGAKSVGDILRYRELLGGYYSVEQISELDVVTDENFRIISQQIYADSVDIKKISINFASPKVLEVHPYLSNRMLRRIINKRELKGGWSTIQEMIDDDIFTEEEAARVAPYLDFGTDLYK